MTEPENDRPRVEIDEGPPRFEVHQDAFATPTTVRRPPQGSISGSLYSRSGSIIRLSQRCGGYHGDHYPSVDAPVLDIRGTPLLDRIEGKSVYLGHFMPHYGHFLVEMLSTFWILESEAPFDWYVFHPFVFGTECTPYIMTAFQTFGIPSEKVKLIERMTILEDVTVPERLVRLNRSANRAMGMVYERLVRALAANQQAPPNARYYLSRVRTSLNSGERAVINEPFIESALRRSGFTVLYPELLCLREQVALINEAQVICGLSGSALHNCVFMRPGAVLIEIADARSPRESHPMQRLCNWLSPADAYFIPFRGCVLDADALMSYMDIGNVKSGLRSIVAGSGLPPEIPEAVRMDAHARFVSLLRGLLMIAKNCLRLIRWRIRKARAITICRSLRGPASDMRRGP